MQLRFPEEQRRLGPLRSLAIPRLLLIADGTPPPACFDALEDWIGVSASARDRAQRAAALERRADRRVCTPTLDETGLLRFQGRSAPLSPTEAVVAGQLIARFGRLVERTTVAHQVWPVGGARVRTLNMHLLKLRRRAAEVGLEIETIRSRGWVMRAVEREDARELVSPS